MENRQEENEELEQISEENVNTVSSSTLSGGTETGGRSDLSIMSEIALETTRQASSLILTTDAAAETGNITLYEAEQVSTAYFICV
uniref:Candidate secreted effector n=1 Tax=Meloidogyne incognita TaxID=6306 RepID=A0A914LVV8_MELIC